MGFYVSECIEEGTTITPPATSNRLEYPRLVNSIIPHTSQIDFGTSTKARGELGLVLLRSDSNPSLSTAWGQMIVDGTPSARTRPKAMSKSQAPVEVAIATEGNAVRIRPIGNAYGNIKTYVNDNGNTLVIIDGLVPDDTNEFIPLSTLKAVFMENYLRIKLHAACVEFYVDALNEQLPEDAEDIKKNEVAGVIFRRLIGKMGIKATYIHHNEGDVWVNKNTGETGSYTQAGWRIDNDSIVLSFGSKDSDAYKAYIACDAAYFVGDMVGADSDEDFAF